MNVFYKIENVIKILFYTLKMQKNKVNENVNEKISTKKVQQIMNQALLNNNTNKNN